MTVTDENKKEYVQLVVEQKLCKSIQPQIDQFLKGFHEVLFAVTKRRTGGYLTGELGR